MSRTFARYMARTYLGLVAAVLVGILFVFLVVDFVDRSRAYTGEGWVADVLLLYANKAVVALHQLGPAALLLAAGMTVSTLARRGEVTAVRALAFGPRALYLPVAACALTCALGLAVLDEFVVGDASRRVDEISVRFRRSSDWGAYYSPRQWLRSGPHILHLRGGSPAEGFTDVTLLTVGEGFRLERRVDAAVMRPVGGSRWRLTQATERSFPASGGTRVAHHGATELDLGIDASALRIRPGRPEQMRAGVLREQIELRARAGLPVRQYELALHNRLAYPLAGLPAALLAVGLALRAGRKGHITAALMEGLAVILGMWGLMVVFRGLATGERLPPVVAAWAPVVLLSALALWLWVRREGGWAAARGRA